MNILTLKEFHELLSDKADEILKALIDTFLLNEKEILEVGINEKDHNKLSLLVGVSNKTLARINVLSCGHSIELKYKNKQISIPILFEKTDRKFVAF
jgi:hypothetical protein